MNTAGTIEALWFKALTVPTNHSDWLYVNPGVDQNDNPISGGGYVGLGTTSPTSTLNIAPSSLPVITGLSTTSTYLALGGSTTTNLLMDSDQIQTKTNATTA